MKIILTFLVFHSILAIGNARLISPEFAQVLNSCRENYSLKMSILFGLPRLKLHIDESMALYQNKTKTDSSIERTSLHDQPFFGVGPGSSGTRSLFLAAMALNITSVHYVLCFANCTYDYNSCYKIPNIQLQLDLPIPNVWWKYLERLPNAKFIMTDIDSITWLKGRMAHVKPGTTSWGYTVPIAFEKADDAEILNALSVNKANASVSKQAHDLYRELVKCAIPKNQLYWIDWDAPEVTPGIFWHGLSSFFNAKVSNSQLQSLISAGIPYWGSKHCGFGNHTRGAKFTKCHFKHHVPISDMPGICSSRLT